MSHEMIGSNKAGNEIAYLRFTMGDFNASVLYDLLDANDYNAGVSGTGQRATIQLLQMEKAMEDYNSLIATHVNEDDEYSVRRKKEILHFLEQCLGEAQKEKSVDVLFC